jgi:hypothetical protein
LPRKAGDLTLAGEIADHISSDDAEPSGSPRCRAIGQIVVDQFDSAVSIRPDQPLIRTDYTNGFAVSQKEKS